MKSLQQISFAVLAGALALAGCKKDSVDVKDADPGTVANKVAAMEVKPQPGRWESTMKIDSFEMPGMPPEAKSMMEKSMMNQRSFATCLTPEEAAKPRADFFNAGKSGCTYDHFTMADGKLDGAMTCNKGPEAMQMTMSGKYGPDAYEIHSSSKVAGGNGRSMTMTMTMNSHRVGDCRGDELGAKPKG